MLIVNMIFSKLPKYYDEILFSTNDENSDHNCSPYLYFLNKNYLLFKNKEFNMIKYSNN